MEVDPMRIFQGTSVANLYPRLADAVANNPDREVSPRGLVTRECDDVVIRHLSPGTDTGCFAGVLRGTDLKYLTRELAWYMCGDNHALVIGQAASLWKDIQNPDGTVNSAYGHTVFTRGQWRTTVNRLVKDQSTRQAVIVYHVPPWFPVEAKDVPCTLTSTFRLRDERLDLVTHMRSQDLWYGYTYDAPWFILTQRLMCLELERQGITAKPGTWTHYADSLHAYEKDHKKLKGIALADAVKLDYPLHDVALRGDLLQPMRNRITGPLANELKEAITWV